MVITAGWLASYRVIDIGNNVANILVGMVALGWDRVSL